MGSWSMIFDKRKLLKRKTTAELVDKRCVAWRREWQKRGSEREERGKNVCGDERTVRETSETGLFVARKLVFRSNFLQPS